MVVVLLVVGNGGCVGSGGSVGSGNDGSGGGWGVEWRAGFIKTVYRRGDKQPRIHYLCVCLHLARWEISGSRSGLISHESCFALFRIQRLPSPHITIVLKSNF